MFRSPAFGLVPLILASIVGASACSAPPQKERDQADDAITSARAAEAAEYAQAELQSALGSLKAYDAAVAKGDYRLALSQAISARDWAYSAAKLAGERKAAAKSEAERAIVDLEGLVMVAKSRLAGSPPPLSPAASDRTRRAVARAGPLLQEARTRLQKQDFKGVVALVQPVVQGLRKDVAPAVGRKGK